MQSISIPDPHLAVVADPHLDSAVQAVADAAEHVEFAAVGLPESVRARRFMELGVGKDPTGAAKRYREAKRIYYDRVRNLEGRLAETYLPHASPLVRRAFTDAVAHHRGEGMEEYVERYRNLATVIEQPQDIIQQISARPWRLVNRDGELGRRMAG